MEINRDERDGIDILGISKKRRFGCFGDKSCLYIGRREDILATARTLFVLVVAFSHSH
jgi:ABC-type microcin C transport system permease subunit YejE